MGNKRKRNNCKDILSERLQAFSTLSWNLESLKTMLIKVSYYCIFIISYYLYLWNLAESFIFFPTASIIPRPLLSSYSLALSPSLPYFIFKIKFKKLWKVSILIFIHYSVQLLSHVRLFVTPWTAACQASLSITSSQNLLKLMSIKSIIPSNYLILCCPLLLLPLTFPSIRIFSNESVLHIRWSKYLASVLPMNIQRVGSIPGLGRSPRAGNSNPLQYSCLENPICREAWQSTVHRVAKSRTWLKQLSTIQHNSLQSRFPLYHFTSLQLLWAL